MRNLLIALSIAALAGCATPQPVELSGADPARDWRSAATSGDRVRLREWRSAFTRALAAARAAGHGREIDTEGALLLPDAALAGPIPNGDYRCRVIKLGARTAGLLDFIAYPAFDCRVQQEKALQGFAKLGGSQRPIGLIFPAEPMRQVFLGTLVLGDEVRAMQYGRDPDRDLAGWVERVGERRWRMVLPSPRFESLTDVIELVPAG